MDPRIQGVDVIITRCESTISLLTLVSLLAVRLIALHQSSRCRIAPHPPSWIVQRHSFAKERLAGHGDPIRCISHLRLTFTCCCPRTRDEPSCHHCVFCRVIYGCASANAPHLPDREGQWYRRSYFVRIFNGRLDVRFESYYCTKYTRALLT